MSSATMLPQIVQEYVTIGGNRHSAASAWSRDSGVLAFGADQNVAIWNPLDPDSHGIEQLLHGHDDKVTAVAFLTGCHEHDSEYLFSGSADGKLAVWTRESQQPKWTRQSQVEAHHGAVNCIATLPASNYFVTGGGDAKIKVWRVEEHEVVEILTILPAPRLIPLTLVLGSFPELSLQDGIFLAAGGTRNDVQVYALRDLARHPTTEHQATLTGHEGWIRSLCVKVVNEHELLLASASHDKYVRLWRFEHGGAKTSKSSNDASQVTSFEQTLTAKAKTVSVANSQFSITFEALLLGHEDWIYSAAWNPSPGSQQLLTASADGTLTIWELDSTSGIWISISRLGEISGQKGATTATGSSGGFWTAMWSPDGLSVTCLGRTGSWRIWTFDSSQQYWTPRHGVSGHTNSANGLTWSPDGSYLLSTSSDQTTRLHAEWKRSSKRTWHEFARPQIHGYDLNCISTTGEHQFASGADEKLLRVFNEPKEIARMLENLSGVVSSNDEELSEIAAIPVLGLSNKAMADGEEPPSETNGDKMPDYITPDSSISLANIQHPPTEDLLARHTLWPEHEKLYGHGYEISESAYSSSNRILATACKASSIDHAVIRLYNTRDWTEMKPPLAAHSLTVTRLAWSLAPDNYLLSTGRDRQWALFRQDENTMNWKLLQSNSKAHTRMILDAAWSPVRGKRFFATAGRDKAVKLWYSKQINPDEDAQFKEVSLIKRNTAVTALSFTYNRDEKVVVLAVGEESGSLSLHLFLVEQDLTLSESIEIDSDICPSKAITRLAWRHEFNNCKTSNGITHLAIAAADGSVRVFAVDVEGLCTIS